MLFVDFDGVEDMGDGFGVAGFVDMGDGGDFLDFTFFVLEFLFVFEGGEDGRVGEYFVDTVCDVHVALDH